MRFTSIDYYNWQNELNAYFKDTIDEQQQILMEWGINSTKSFFIKKFINLLCRKGRNSDKFELNNTRFLNILLHIKQLMPNEKPVIIFVKALLNGRILLQTMYTRQGSVNTPRKIFLFPNVVASVTLRKVAEFARSMNPKGFANEIKLLYEKDNKSKVYSYKNEQHRLSCLGAE